MNLIKKCLLEFNNKYTNKITEKDVNDDTELRFTLLDMQKFVRMYNEAIAVAHSCCKLKDKEVKTFDYWLIDNKYTLINGDVYQGNNGLLKKRDFLEKMYLAEISL